MPLRTAIQNRQNQIADAPEPTADDKLRQMMKERDEAQKAPKPKPSSADEIGQNVIDYSKNQ